MIETPIALGMYSVLQSATAHLDETMAQVAAMGYEAVEMYGEPAQFPAKAVKRALSDAGLPLIGWHIEWAHLQQDTLARSIDFFQEAGLPCVVIPCLGGKWSVGHTPAEESEQVWNRYLERIETVRARLAGADIRLGYHNHEHEFEIRYQGRSLFDKLYGAMHPDIVMELDTGNAIEGGADPAAILKAHQTRQVFLHCKPYGPTDGFDVPLGGEADANDWATTLCAGKANCEYLIIESESKAMPEMENARQSLLALRRIVRGDGNNNV